MTISNRKTQISSNVTRFAHCTRIQKSNFASLECFFASVDHMYILFGFSKKNVQLKVLPNDMTDSIYHCN